MQRRLFQLNGKYYAWASDHPLEERLIELTDDYRDAHGDFILPEAVAWDGVETCPGVNIRPVDDDD